MGTSTRDERFHKNHLDRQPKRQRAGEKSCRSDARPGQRQGSPEPGHDDQRRQPRQARIHRRTMPRRVIGHDGPEQHARPGPAMEEGQQPAAPLIEELGEPGPQCPQGHRRPRQTRCQQPQWVQEDFQPVRVMFMMLGNITRHQPGQGFRKDGGGKQIPPCGQHGGRDPSKYQDCPKNGGQHMLPAPQQPQMAAPP